MKNLLKLSILAIAAIVALPFTSCDKVEPTPEPTVRFLAEVNADNSYQVDITLESTDATTFAWTYGDEGSSAEAASHSYTYEASGEYTITVVATGEGGEARDSVDVTIVAGIEEIIAGTDATGKTWVLTQAEGSFAGKLGASDVANDFTFLPGQDLIPNGVIAAYGLGDEYTDEFTFYKDGKFTVDVKNAQSLAGVMYGNLTQSIAKPSDDFEALPLCAVNYASITDGTWAVSYDDMVVKAYNEFGGATSVEDVTFTFGENSSEANLVLSTGGYVGLVDLAYPAIAELGLTEAVDNSIYIIKKVTPDVMEVAIAMNGVPFMEADGSAAYDPSATTTNIFMYPTMFMHLVLVPAE